MVTFSYGEVLTAGQWAALFAGKQDALGYTPVDRAGDTMQGPLTTVASTSINAGFSIPPGTPPAQPVDGNVWMTSAGLFVRIGGATIGPIVNGNVVGPATSAVGNIATFSTTGGMAITDSGISLGSQAANLIMATPAFGAGVPAFRALVGADLPAPQAVALGGVRSASASTHQFMIGIDTSGDLLFGQPAIGDISGLAANMAAFLAGGTSAQLLAAVPDATGSGPLVFGTNPTVTLASASTAVTQAPADNSTKVATTAYVQAAIFATTTLPASEYATTAALPAVTYSNGASGVGATLTATANGALSVDGSAVNVNDVILVKNQASTFQNGIYTVTATGGAGAPFVLTRATWYNLSADIDLGDQTFIVGGATYASTTWAQNGTENPVIGTDPITFAQTAGLGAYTAGNGLNLVGTQFSIDTSVTVDQTSVQALSNKSVGATALTDSGPLALTGVISPAALAAGNTTDYNPAGLATASTLRLTPNTGGSSLTGIAAQPAGTVLNISNVGSGILILYGKASSSLAANQFSNSAPLLVYPGQSTILWYDGTSNLWRVCETQTASPPASARKNLKIVTTSVTASTITADQLVLEDTLGNTYRATSVNVSYATGSSGANGLDTGTIAASTWYYEWVIYNATTNTVASLLSLSSTAPTMPSGYTFKARVGAIYYDAGSALRFKIQYDRKAQIVIGTNPTATLWAASGAAGTYSSSSPALISVSLASFVPPTAASAMVVLNPWYLNGSQSSIIVAPSQVYSGTNNGPTGNKGVYPSSWISNANTSITGQVVWIGLEAQSLSWASSSAGGAMGIMGWEDNL